MRATERTLTVGAIVALILAAIIATSAPANAQQESCPEGWGDVWASGGFSDGRQAVVTGDTLEAWNFFDSESTGNLYANGVLLGPAPGPNQEFATYDLPSEGTWTISAADGRVSVCVRAVVQPPETTITTTLPPKDTTTTTTTLPPKDTTTTTTSTTIPEEPTTTTSTVVPNETTTTIVATTTTLPAVTSSTAPTTTAVPSTSEPPTPSVPPTTPTEPPPPELPATGVSLGWVAAFGAMLLGTGVALETWQRRRQRHDT